MGAEDEGEYGPPIPEKSFVLVQIVEGSSYLFESWEKDFGLEFWEMWSEGGSAAIELEAGMLDDAIAPLLYPNFWRAGWFVVEGFYGHFTTDYWGDVDCDHECDRVRIARWSDLKRMGVPRPWLIRCLMALGWDEEVPPGYEPVPLPPLPA